MHRYDICKTHFGVSWLGVFHRGLFALLLIPRPSDASESETSLEHLEGLLNSHTQSLMKINTYLVKIDQLYHWYSKNHRRLDEQLPECTTGGGDLLDQLQRLAERMDYLEDKNNNFTTFLDYKNQQVWQTVSSFDARLSNLEEKQRKRDDQLASVSARLNATNAVENLVMFNRQMASKCNKSIEEMSDNMNRFTDRFEKIESFFANLTSESDAFKNETSYFQSDLAAKVAAIESFRNVCLESNIYLDENVQSLQQNVRSLYNRTNGYDSIVEELDRLKQELATFNRSGRSAGTVTPELQDDVVQIKTRLHQLESDMKSLKTHEPGGSGVTTVTVEQLSARLGELEGKVGQQNSVRERGDELFSRLTGGGLGATADDKLPGLWRTNTVG